ncbi:hypothetical protein MACH24_06720 [Erythrobacter sp. Dej080120_24]|uniref:hypothetical protein n=1 Tax=Erythrobacter sp. Dej080120_24 TaxID=3024837 RepID=UPI002923E901|nr:hypothetical protein MACH24_06720 [Erythrobacter sp. Dej080120_24]
MSGFHSTLLLGGRPIDAVALREAIVAGSCRELQPGDYGTLQFADNGGERRTLMIEAIGGHGFSLAYDIYSQQQPMANSMWYSQGKEHAEGWLESDAEATVPASSLVSGEEAVRAIAEFLNCPVAAPASLAWTDSNNLEWPEVF